MSSKFSRKKNYLLLPLLAVIVLTLSQVSSHDAYAAPIWSASGPGTVTVTNPDQGINGQAQFTYSINLGGGGVPTKTWTFETTAAQTGPVTLDYTWSGYHAYYQVTTFLNKLDSTGTTGLVHQGPVNCCTSPSGGFSYIGSVTFNAVAGQTYGFTLGGSNYDSDSRLLGTFTVKSTAPLDTTPPVITPVVTGTLGNNGWYTSDVNVSWTVTDPESSISSKSGCDTTVLNTDTAGTVLTCTATSAGGTSTNSITIKRDATTPTITGAATTSPNANGWYNGPVTIHYTSSDSLSGLVATPADTVISTEGAAQSVTQTVTDLAGNTASVTVGPINIDMTTPGITYTLSPSPNANGWNDGPVIVTFTCNDSLSGVDTCSSPVTISAEGANQQVTGSATDKAGNTASVIATLNIDMTTPEAYNQFDPTTKNVVLYGTDSLSGITTNPIAPTSVIPAKWGDGDKEKSDDNDKNDKNAELRTYTVTDKAGNIMILIEKVKVKGNEAQVHMISVKYNNGAVMPLTSNSEDFEWSVAKDNSIKKVSQKVTIGKDDSGLQVEAKYNAEKNTTIINTENGQSDTKLTKSGLVLLHVATSNGQILVNGY